MNESDDLLQLRVLSFRFFRMGMAGSAALRRGKIRTLAKEMLRELQLQRIDLPVADIAHDDR